MINQAQTKFPRVYWFANLTELFERAAYYSMLSFVVIYLGQLGLGTYYPALLYTLLSYLIYFLPILSGPIATRSVSGGLSSRLSCWYRSAIS